MQAYPFELPSHSKPLEINLFNQEGSGLIFKSSSEISREIPPELKRRVLMRDDYTCQHCGFHSAKYQEISVADYHFFDPDRCHTACIFCSAYSRLEFVSPSRSGRLIWFPEISPVQLNHLARDLYVARLHKGEVAQRARDTLDHLMGLSAEAIQKVGTDQPEGLARQLQSGHVSEEIMAGLRLFPIDRRIINEAGLEFNQFPQILAFWRSKRGPYGFFAGKTNLYWLDWFLNQFPQYNQPYP